MCGICGIVQVAGDRRDVVATDVLDRMTDVMTHRGPNDRGTHIAPGIALGVRRLSVIDVEAGHQPFGNEDGSVWAVQNGELFNYLPLRQELLRQGHDFSTRSDTEVIPHLYEQHGPYFAERLNGMFAIAVWDETAQRAVIVRDRLGVKPLYYAVAGDLLVFGSELKAVLASGLVSFDLDFEAIDAYLTLGFFPGVMTPFRGVAKVPPGAMIVVDHGVARVERWWRYPQPAYDGRTESLRANAEILLELLEDCVRLRLMSDVPLGAMLSGGLDSSLIVGLMARHSAEPVKTFSVGFAEDAESSELADARLVSSMFGTDHHELVLSYADFAVDPADLVWHLDEPLADLSTLGFQALSRLASHHVTVALCGQGGDELFGGYPKHRAARLAAYTRWLPSGVLARVGRMGAPLPPTAARLARTAAADGPTARLLAMSSLTSHEERRAMARGGLELAAGDAAARAVAELAGGVSSDPLSETLYIDGQLALVDDMLLYSDRASMAHSLEVRVPFLDYRMVEWSATVPPGHKVSRGITKRVLRDAARGLLPGSIIDKKKIGFFSLTANAWLARQLDLALAEILLDPGARVGDFLDRGMLESLVRDHSASVEKQRGRFLLAILMLELWLREFVPRAAALASSEQPAGMPR